MVIIFIKKLELSILSKKLRPTHTLHKTIEKFFHQKKQPNTKTHVPSSITFTHFPEMTKHTSQETTITHITHPRGRAGSASITFMAAKFRRF